MSVLKLCPDCSDVLSGNSSQCFNCRETEPELTFPAPYRSPLPVRQAGIGFEKAGVLIGLTGLVMLVISSWQGVAIALILMGAAAYVYGRGRRL